MKLPQHVQERLLSVLEKLDRPLPPVDPGLAAMDRRQKEINYLQQQRATPMVQYELDEAWRDYMNLYDKYMGRQDPFDAPHELTLHTGRKHDRKKELDALIKRRQKILKKVGKVPTTTTTTTTPTTPELIEGFVKKRKKKRKPKKLTENFVGSALNVYELTEPVTKWRQAYTLK